MTNSLPLRSEHRRLSALLRLNVLDSAPEHASEAIAAAAASIANVPISAISLIDSDRQWFKASCGLQDLQTPRAISFCSHTILENGPMIVEDPTSDERFKGNPLVNEAPYIRFYAGFPLNVNGENVGALCVIDNRARKLTPDQIRRLEELATTTSAWLQARDSGR